MGQEEGSAVENRTCNVNFGNLPCMFDEGWVLNTLTSSIAAILPHSHGGMSSYIQSNKEIPRKNVLVVNWGGGEGWVKFVTSH